MRACVAKTMGIVALLVTGAAFAWEEPDSVYAKFHNAVMTGNAEEMLRLTTSARRADLAGRKDLELRQTHATLPAAYALERKTVSRDGQSARLYFSAAGEAFPTPKAGAQYGIVRMALEGGEWKLIDQSWAREKPAEIAPARAQVPEGGRLRDMTRPAVPAAATKPPLLRIAKPACSFQPVMSDEEIDRCR
jgi:hypothetical protein